MLEIAVQMDPLEKINFSSDSTFALMLEAARRGHRLWFYTPDRLSLADGRPIAFAREIAVRDKPGDYYTLGDERELDLAEVDVVLLRQDPPFDLAYITSTHFLERISSRVLVVNDPAHVRNAPEKLFVTEFLDLMPPTLITRDKAAIERFRARHGEIVMKPLYGHGGASVFKVAARDPNFGSLFDLFATTFREPWVVQRFLPRVVEGDKRILLVEGEALGAVNRVPALDDIRSNMVRGGVASATELTPREREICGRLQPALVARGLLFVGIDVIDGWLTEINVTSPTGLRALARHGGPDLSSTIIDVIERRRAEQRASR
ncbi:glutathione synthase [Methylocystis bryophila]|uniref:Glutathione synthetase n=1 Tax=Methylocystis bryophila TaxID=655015 RepID=A0A1W6MUJ7_9HYPH|nr:glutathione synthase [Methylocystis bryophila]ARN81288.1 glutathione synthase [Methylocystis bryophila]BDV37250.1 glutathione synthetase [Methylocystis bryophila]